MLSNMLYFVGLGLSDEKDISVKGLEIVRKCSKIFLETYTSKLLVDKKRLEEFYGREIIDADRTMVESNSDIIIDSAANEDACFLVVGDPFGATTHSDLFLRAHEKGIAVKVIHNVSIMNAIGETGLELYKFGKTTSVPFPMPNFRPETPYNVLLENKANGLHTLVLLDIKVPENRFMTVNDAIRYLLELESSRKEGAFTPETICIGIARIGSDSQKIVSGTASQLKDYDFGLPLHSLIVPGNLHFIEEDMIKFFSI